MRNMILASLSGALVFAGLSWWTARPSVHAAVLTAPPAGRFELIQLHPNAASEWSGILDTETGCVWVYATATLPDSPKTSFEVYQALRGSHFFELVNFDASDYAYPEPVSQGGTTAHLPSTVIDFSKPYSELQRVSVLCNQARVGAMEAAAPR